MATDLFLDAAIEQARKSLSEGGIPIGSVLVHAGKIIGRGHNCRVQNGSPIDHGEMNCLRNAGRLPAKIYTTSSKHYAKLAKTSKLVRKALVSQAHTLIAPYWRPRGL